MTYHYSGKACREGQEKTGPPHQGGFLQEQKKADWVPPPLIETPVVISSRGHYPTADHQFLAGGVKEEAINSFEDDTSGNTFKSGRLADRWCKGKQTEILTDRISFVSS